MTPADPRITFRRLREHDLPLIGSWLAQPHVHRWWHHDSSPEAVARDFGATLRGEERNEDLLVLLDGEPVGLVQRCRLDDYPDYREELAALTEVPSGTLTIDYLLGPPDAIGQGLGPRVIAAACADAWAAYADAPAVVVPVAAANTRSWRALEKAGFTRTAEGDLEPDNPIDDRWHFVYRRDRPDVR